MQSYNFYNYPNPTSITPYKTGYRDNFTNQQLGMGGAITSYALRHFSGAGSTKFNASSSLPVLSGVVDKFDTPLQFRSGQYSAVLSHLMNRSLPFAQGLPYNIYAANGGQLFQLGSQHYNLLNPALLYPGRYF